MNSPILLIAMLINQTPTRPNIPNALYDFTRMYEENTSNLLMIKIEII